MEAANRGAADAGGRTIGLNIGLPHEQRPNPYITPGLSFEFHYFFTRKLWFAHLARAMVAFPGGFGTLDELCEILTLSQTRKLARPIPVLLYGPSYWNELINFQALVRHGMISPRDLELFRFVDSPGEAFRTLKEGLSGVMVPATPAFAKTVTSCISVVLESIAPLFTSTSVPANLLPSTVPVASFVWPANLPAGVYTFFMAATPPAALGNGTMGPRTLLSVTTAPVTYTP